MKNMQQKLKNLANELRKKRDEEKEKIENALNLKEHHRSIFIDAIDACDESQEDYEKRREDLRFNLGKIEKDISHLQKQLQKQEKVNK